MKLETFLLIITVLFCTLPSSIVQGQETCTFQLLGEERYAVTTKKDILGRMKQLCRNIGGHLHNPKNDIHIQFAEDAGVNKLHTNAGPGAGYIYRYNRGSGRQVQTTAGGTVAVKFGFDCLFYNVGEDKYVPHSCRKKLKAMCHIVPKYRLPYAELEVNVLDDYNGDLALEGTEVVVEGVGFVKGPRETPFTGQVSWSKLTCADSIIDYHVYCPFTQKDISAVSLSTLNVTSVANIYTSHCNSFLLQPAALSDRFQAYHNTGATPNPVTSINTPALIPSTGDIQFGSVSCDGSNSPACFNSWTAAAVFTKGYYDPGTFVVFIVENMLQAEADIARFMITDQNGKRLRPYRLVTPPNSGLLTYWVIGCWEPVANNFIKVNDFVDTLPPDLVTEYCI